MNKILFLFTLLTLICFNQTLSQSKKSIAISGHGRIDFFHYSQTNGRSVNGIALEFNPSIIYFHKIMYDNPSLHRYGIGLRTSIYYHHKTSKEWEQYIYNIGLYPLGRYYLKTRSFLEISGGPSIMIWQNQIKTPGNVYTDPAGKFLLWKIHMGLGQDIKLSDQTSIELIVAYQIQRAGLLNISQADELFGEKESGLKILIGFSYRLFK